MEKPRKKEWPEGMSVGWADGWNDCHDAMSTWLEGEVPSKEELRKIVVKALDIENLKASEEIMKNFPMTVLEICNGADEIVDNVHALLLRKLKGKV